MIAQRLRLVPDVLLPLVLLGLFLFTPYRSVRVLSLAILVVRVLATVYGWLVPRFVRVTRERKIVHAHRYQPFEVELTIHNTGFLPIHYMTVQDTAANLVSHGGSFVIGLGPGQKKTLTYTCEGHHRGDFTIGPVMVRGADPLGFYKWERRLEVTIPVIVYPSVFALQMDEKTGLPSGSIQVMNRLYEDLTRFRSVREYMPGDELKRINWKVSARQGKLFSMEYVPSIYYPVLVAVNLTDQDYPNSQKQHLVERTIEMAASLVFFFVGLKQQVGLQTTGSIRGEEGHPRAPAKPGYGHAINLLEILARIGTSDGKSDFTERLLAQAIPTGAKVMVVTPPLKQGQADALLGLRRRGYDLRIFLATTHQMKREDTEVHGIKSFSIREQGTQLVGR